MNKEEEQTNNNSSIITRWFFILAPIIGIAMGYFYLQNRNLEATENTTLVRASKDENFKCFSKNEFRESVIDIINKIDTVNNMGIEEIVDMQFSIHEK